MSVKKTEWTRIEMLGANVRRERLRKKLTQEELAERVEIATRNLQKIEAGEINVRANTIYRIQSVLRCPWKRLMSIR